ncbi:MAG: hypothetical protein A3C15_02640 [Candidatus Magasanikbacteria bacterium RIFCSPHIGHO2_02_FULL_50_9b]|uniref:Uncharacterized protein n=1 Tax=Candidatus Magasanikbacteria bacterium RIFCSPHIGHO2_02_FULL_50_9b TaxID=1798682 RepID=A0A1F6M7X1_9BACT|nr:MAG: hypothetical protein A3C15_02640 [Candidatus Magasanikbacteria bacterium RIFCSPHIGHO2_02_FULL_50_9b]
MKAAFKEQPPHPAHVFMRAAGYAKHANRDGDESYVRRVSGNDFPRFHVYVNDGAVTTLSIHIDQKAHTYEGSKAHSGEYSGALLADELARISAAINCKMVIMVDKKGKPLDR